MPVIAHPNCSLSLLQMQMFIFFWLVLEQLQQTIGKITVFIKMFSFERQKTNFRRVNATYDLFRTSNLLSNSYLWRYSLTSKPTGRLMKAWGSLAHKYVNSTAHMAHLGKHMVSYCDGKHWSSLLLTFVSVTIHKCVWNAMLVSFNHNLCVELVLLQKLQSTKLIKHY